ncbi:hypothetical protein [Rhodoferax sp.]|uniref:hypothetical protein n=1 Tax=Rhodoferax sp. TaxID=50421 RepID=UPI0025CF19CD|nr:hypothetical protein [Rhodoferax sp.]
MPLNLSPQPRLQRGQSSVEYLTVSAFAAIVLLVPDDSGNVVVVQLANAIKTYYNAFAYALSYSSTITPF